MSDDVGVSDEEPIFSRQLGLNVRPFTIDLTTDSGMNWLTEADRVQASLTADDIRRAVTRMRADWGRQPNTLIMPQWMLEWPRRLMFTGYPDVLDRTRPWPRVVLFPRWDEWERRARGWWRWNINVRWYRVNERLHGRRSEW